ncbi:MAG: molybdenum cofactor biosynthesis protein MoaE [Sphingobacteriia bacterium]|nr:MAG: molybdenum cofactor biosynthesis protein MoaE [Sphingobacteriia bacterium]TAG30279.1 MAG: molybdenum cofactor biosynthesis protein MoaE [Sphingobacteriia bacterium]TAH08614.1 MAG: molybdenum cofactor biosynthesis protein MoaE [Sphingobacteriia bacterium]
MSEKKIRNIFYQGPIPADKIAADLQQHASNTDIGAHSIFIGQVRADQKETDSVAAIEYTAYPEMALEKMAEIRADLFIRYPLTCMHVHHSLGRVNIGEICLFVFVSSKHRKAAMDACEAMVEAIKKELPIWGKEICSNDAEYWKQNK